ncbi:pyrimidine reductase family protein [Rhizohabitans arisaemae]|uniref:pyrimidine reductase family protein n=1 Tax=Rhizohabitans arisaemae TaxID=2720610 RepID=UPI0024B17538|nr:pyrimidine reductase family protein [Rhizohabitans arisaemae]
MRRIFPEPAVDIDLAQAYAYADGPCVRANMVASADGAAWVKGLSGGLSGRGDRRAFAVLRGLADVILAGATTVRSEGYGPVRPRDSWAGLRAGRTAAPPIAVVTRKLDLDLDGRLFTEAEPYARTIVITTESAPADRRARAAELADVVVAGDDRVEPAAAVQALRDRGLPHVLCEGGPRLLAQFGAADLIDELCLTISPMLVGGEASRILNGPAARSRMRLVHVLEEEGFLLCRYRR